MVKATLVKDSLMFHQEDGSVQNFSVTFDKPGVNIDVVGQVAIKSGQVGSCIAPLSLLAQEATEQYVFSVIRGKLADQTAVEGFIDLLNRDVSIKRL